MSHTEDDTIRVLKRKITTRQEMDKLAREKFPAGSSILDMEMWLISEGWTLEEWKQTQRDKRKGLL